MRPLSLPMPQPFTCFFRHKPHYRLSCFVHRICGAAGFPFFLLLILTLGPEGLASEDQVVIHSSLRLQVEAVLDYYREHRIQDPLCQGENAEKRQIVLQELKRLLISRPDPGTISRSRLRELFRFKPVNPSGRIRLTRYAAFTVPGRKRPDRIYNTPLLEIPADEMGLSEAQAEKKRGTLLRFRHTRQEILDGALGRQSRPLAWLRRRDLEEAQIQGSVRVLFPSSGDSPFFNVSRSNGMPWLTERTPSAQNRYWFFREVPRPLGYGLWSDWQLPIHGMAALAGDLRHFGLGAVILLVGERECRLLVLADTGGAFENNQVQFDLFLGIMADREAYRRLNRSLPEQAQAFILE